MKISRIFIFVTVIILSSCKAYKQDIILRFDDEFSSEDLQKSIDRVTKNYVLIPGEVFQLDVFTNNGERLIDPNFELSEQGGIAQNNQQVRNRFNYLVMDDGTVRLPMVGLQAVSGLTINETEELLQKAYSQFYTDTFVKISPTNRRVTLLGGFLGGGTVIPLSNENMTVLEVMALAGGLELGSDAAHIKLVRGNINDPQVFSIDLSTVSGMQKTGMIVESGDVLYAEPWRRPFRQSLNDIAPVLSLATSVTTFVLVLTTTARNNTNSNN